MEINSDIIISGTNTKLADVINIPDVYSGEVKTDKVWMDGKPIYRYVGSTTKSQVATIMNGLKIDYLVSTVGSWAKAQYDNCWPIPCYYVAEAGYRINVMGGNTPGKNVSISFESFYRDNDPVVLCLEYTKQ